MSEDGEYSCCGPTGCGSVARASPACPLSGMYGKRPPQSPPMTAKFWGNPYDTRDGKRFIVDCIVRPSREYMRAHELAACAESLINLYVWACTPSRFIHMRLAFVPHSQSFSGAPA